MDDKNFACQFQATVRCWELYRGLAAETRPNSYLLQTRPCTDSNSLLGIVLEVVGEDLMQHWPEQLQKVHGHSELVSAKFFN